MLSNASLPRAFSFSLLPRSFGGQLAGAFALLGVLLALGLSVALGAMSMERSRRDAGSALRNVADNAATVLAQGLALRLREVQTLAGSAPLWAQGLEAPGVEQAIERSQAIHAHSAWIGVADAQGVVRNATGKLLLGANVGERPWFQAGLRGPYLGDVHAAKLLAKLLPPGSDGGPQRFVDFAAPIYVDGRLLGVLGVHGSWEWTRSTIESLLPEHAAREGIEVFVFDRNGQMIYAAEGLQRFVAAGQGLPLAAGRAAPAEGTGRAALVRWRDGESYLTAASALASPPDANGLNWTVVVRRPAALAYAAGREAALRALQLGLLAALLAAACGRWLAARLTQPLRLMARDAHALETASAPQELPPRSGSLEVERLSNALSAMTRRLLGANAELEARVQARTLELERANAALEQLAQHDPLTGLLNRRGFDERLAVLLASAQRRHAPVSMLVLDVDHFKHVNDRHGHDVGDAVLKAIAGVLRQRLREVDIVARLGGEEFIVVLADTASHAAAHVAGALLEAVRGAPLAGSISVTVSCGVAEWAGSGETPGAALRRADAALYRAKQTGRDRVCLDGAAKHGEPAFALPA